MTQHQSNKTTKEKPMNEENTQDEKTKLTNTPNPSGGPEHKCLTRTDGRWHLCDDCEAEFNAGKFVYPFNEPEWVRLYPNESQPRWQDAYKQALAKRCEICEEPLPQEPDTYIWFHLDDGVAQCPDCRETAWWDDGYELGADGPHSWNHRHTREQRIAERGLAILEKRTTREWKASPEGKAVLESARLECERLQVYA
jgi:hypothetical protein